MTIDWKICPAGCGKEFACMETLAYSTKEGERRELVMCPDCAFTVAGFAFLANELPIPDANVIPLKLTMTKIALPGGRFFMAYNDSSKIGDLTVTDSWGLFEARAKCSSSLRVWLWILNRIRTVTSPEVASAAPAKTPAGRSALLKRVLDGKKKAT